MPYPGHTGTMMFSYGFLNRVVVVRDRIRIVGPCGIIKGGDNESPLFLERGKVEVEEREQPFPALVVLVKVVRVGGGVVGYRASGEFGDSALADAILTVVEHVRHVERVKGAGSRRRRPGRTCPSHCRCWSSECSWWCTRRREGRERRAFGIRERTNLGMCRPMTP